MLFFFVTGLSSDAPVPAEGVELGGGCTRERCRTSPTRDMQTRRILILVLLISIPPRGRKWTGSGSLNDVTGAEPAARRFTVRFFCFLSRYYDQFKSLVARNIML